MAQTRQRGLSLKNVTFALTLVVLAGCTHSASQQFRIKATKLGFVERTVSTELFDLTVYSNSAAHNIEHEELHIYLAGDGQPFFRHRYVNKDPSPRQGLILELMSKDSSPAVMIGRPCYHLPFDKTESRGCSDNRWWTTHRYSQEVVNAVAEAITLIARKDSKLTLIGFSGGGTLATLIAQDSKISRLIKLKKLIGINPNLDIHAWTKLHNYSPLYGSLNPIESANSLPANTQTVFLTGKQDSNVPIALWQEVYQDINNVRISLYPSFTHTCCWSDVWAQIITELDDS